MQIAQFLVGASYAMAHSFITYTIPVSISDLQRSGAMDPAGAIKGASVVSPSAAATNGAVVEDDTPARRHQHSPDMATAQVPLPCVTTAGETFAIWLNVLYLAPLTYLFVRFFIRSYLRRSSQEAAVAAWSRGSTGGAAAGGAINGGVGNATVTEKRRRRFSDVALRAERAGWDAAKDMQREVYGEGQAENGTGAGVQAR